MDNRAGIKKALTWLKENEVTPGVLTPGELIETCIQLNIKFSDVVIAESVIETGWSTGEFFNRIHNDSTVTPAIIIKTLLRRSGNELEKTFNIFAALCQRH